MAAAVLLHLEVAGGPEEGRSWTLELSPEQAMLRDDSGTLRNAFSPEDAVRDWVMPSFVRGNRLAIPSDEGLVAFECRRSGLRHLRTFLRAGVRGVGPKAVRAAWLRAVGEFVLGVVLSGVAVWGTLANFAPTANTGSGTIYYGLLLVGLIEVGRGAYLLRECVLLSRETRRRSFAMPPAPEREAAAGEASVIDLPPRRGGRRPVEVFIWVVGGFLALSFAGAVVVVVVGSWWKPAPGRPTAGASNAPSPLASPPAAASTQPDARRLDETRGDNPRGGTASEPSEPPRRQPEVEIVRDVGPVLVAGSVEIIDPPASVRSGEFVSNKRVRLFVEREDRVLTEAVACDATAPATMNAAAPDARGAIEPGVRVTSYLLHANTVGGEVADLEGEITFPAEIIGVIVNRDSLDASDEPLGREGVAYPTGGRWRGWLDGDSTDWVTISPDRRTLSFRSSTGRWVDQIRVVVRGR